MQGFHNSSATDEELILQYQMGGSIELLGCLLSRYSILAFGVAMKYLKDRSLAEDAVQQAFCKIIDRFPKEPIYNFKGWLYVVIRNQCLQTLRDNKCSPLESFNSETIDDIDTEKNDSAWKLVTDEDLETALGLLPEQQRVSIQLFFLKELSYKQIEDQTGYTFLQIKSYIQNGKRNLKNILTKMQSTRG
ncbi:MAG: sigma-70 family RNA polymerase sigma factor [Bacteroidetes bacterium]|nr:sigma-70 family RNA polymerase sigma factor [Bacteroidota bacterium]MBS1741355.1 sigma-70 family RNA polymerase sigma factor [Bacteroidota bacterium]